MEGKSSHSYLALSSLLLPWLGFQGEAKSGQTKSALPCIAEPTLEMAFDVLTIEEK